MCVELPRRSLAAYAVQQYYVPLLSYNIETQFCCTTYEARDILGNYTHSLEPFSLRSLLYIAFLQYTLTLSLSVNPCGLLHTCSMI